jgi:hypothetical protein
MTDEELRWHIWENLSAKDFTKGEMVSFSYFIPSTRSSRKDVRSKRGDILPKKRWGIVDSQKHFMEVIVFDTAHGTGPMHKPLEKRVRCFGIATEGTTYMCRSSKDSSELVAYAPEEGVFYVPRDIEYKADPGVSGDVLNTHRLNYDTRVWGHGEMSREQFDKLLLLRAKRLIQQVVGNLPAEDAESVLEARLVLVRERKDREEERRRITEDLAKAQRLEVSTTEMQSRDSEAAWRSRVRGPMRQGDEGLLGLSPQPLRLTQQVCSVQVFVLSSNSFL